MRKEPNAKLRPRAAVIRGAVLGVACMLVAVGWAATRTTQQNTLKSKATRANHAAADARTGVTAQVVPVQAPDAPAWRYDAVVKRNLFRPPVAPAPQNLRAPHNAPALPPLAPMPIDAFTQVGLGDDGTGTASGEAQAPQWTYAGYATADGNPVAIVENSSTKTAEFLRVGQTLDGFAVTEIKPESVQLTRDGETKTLRISDAFTATPLNEPPRPQRESARDRGGRWRGGFPGGGPGGDFFRRMVPALRDNPEFADQARRFLDNLAGPDQPSTPGPPAPGGGLQPQGGTP